MMTMLRLTKKRMTGRLEFKLLLSLLTVSLLSGCAGLKPFPEKYLYEYDAKHKVCGQYQIVDEENLKYEYVKDVPCVSIFGFTAKGIPNVLNWGRDAKKYAQEHCH